MYVSVTLAGASSGERVFTSPPLISSPPGAIVRNGPTPGVGVIRMMYGKGVVPPGTTSSSSSAN